MKRGIDCGVGSSPPQQHSGFSQHHFYIAKDVNAKLLPFDSAPQGYKDSDRGASVKHILDPRGLAKMM